MRRNYLANQHFQLRFALELVAVVVLVPLGIWVNYYLIGQYILIDEGLLTSKTSDWDTALILLNQQWGWIMGLFVFSVAVTGFCVLAYTHRVAGPIYRLEQAVCRLAEGDLGRETRLRKHDYFDNLATDVNQLERHFRDTLLKLQITTQSIRKRADEIDEPGTAEAAETLQTILDQYQL